MVERNLGERNALATKRISKAVALTDPSPPSEARYETRVKLSRVPKEKMHDPIVYHELEQLGEGAVGSLSRVMSHSC